MLVPLKALADEQAAVFSLALSGTQCKVGAFHGGRDEKLSKTVGNIHGSNLTSHQL